MAHRPLLALATLALTAAPTAHAEEPKITMAQLPGKEGCLSADDADAADCKSIAWGHWGSLAVSPDGSTVYGVGGDDTGASGIAIFSRHRLTGELTEQGCISARPADGCSTDPLVEYASDVTVSPDGTNLYVNSNPTPEMLLVFARDRTTGEFERVQCLAVGEVEGCESVPDLSRPVVSPDGRHVYLGYGFFPDGAPLFDRDPTSGRLTNSRCMYALEADEQCPTEPIGQVSADGRFAYGSAFGFGWSDVITTYSRDPATGTLTEVPCPPRPYDYDCRPHGTNGRFSDVAVTPDGRNVVASEWFPERGWLFNFDADPGSGLLTRTNCFRTGGEPDGCSPVPALDSPMDVEVAPDGRAVYLPSGPVWANVGGVSMYDRDPATGALALGNCVTEDGAGGACVIGHAIGAALRAAVSPDSRNVYLVAPPAIGVLGLAVGIASDPLPVSDDDEVAPDLSCPEAPEYCEGRVSLRTVKRFRVRRGGHMVKRRLTIGSRRFTIPAGDSKRVRIRLTKRARKLMRRSSHVRTRARVSARSLPGRTVREIRVQVPSGS